VEHELADHRDSHDYLDHELGELEHHHEYALDDHRECAVRGHPDHRECAVRDRQNYESGDHRANVQPELVLHRDLVRDENLLDQCANVPEHHPDNEQAWYHWHSCGADQHQCDHQLNALAGHLAHYVPARDDHLHRGGGGVLRD
jgi:hypothetical protein